MKHCAAGDNVVFGSFVSDRCQTSEELFLEFLLYISAEQSEKCKTVEYVRTGFIFELTCLM